MNKKYNKNFAIIIDSSAGYEKKILQKYDNLYVFPLTIIVNYQEIADKLENIDFDKMVNYFNDGIYPTTAAPNPATFCTFINELYKKYDKIYVLPLSSQYSGAYNNLLMISDMKKYKKKLFIFETHSIFLGILSLIPHLYSDFQKNLPFKDIQDKITYLAPNFIHYFVPRDVSIFKNSGRIHVAQELLINFLKLKIVFKFVNEAKLLDKVRTLDVAKDVICTDINNLLKEFPNSKILVPITLEQKSSIIIDEYSSYLNSKNIEYCEVYSNVIMAHIGIPLICIFVERIK